MSSVVISGNTSGTITLDAPNVAGNTTLTLPTTSGTVVVTTGNQTVEFADGSASAPSITNSGDTNTGIFFPAADTIAFAEGGVEAMRLDASGNVLVGTTSGTGRVNVSGLSSFNVTNSSVIGNAAIVTSGSYGGGVSIIDGTQGYTLWAQTSGADFYIRRATTTGSYTGGVALINAATSWSSASDENIKDIIEPITNGLEKVSTLRTVIGKYKDEAEGIRHPFLIAQDVQKVLPEAVSILNNGEINQCLGLSYTDTIPLLVKAIQELKAIVDEQAEKIKALEAK